MTIPALLTKTPIRLADGRELIYFDERAAGRAAREERRSAAAAPAVTSEIRRDPLSGEWVVIASHRQDRTHLPPSDECPLCPSRPGHPTEIPAADYDVVAFENRFPSLGAPPDPAVGGAADRNGAVGTASASGGAGAPGDTSSLVPRRPAAGRCEVVCFTADHAASFGTLSPRRVRTVVEVWVDRTVALSALSGVEEVFCFENRGEAIGVTLHHPHGQIYAYPFVTPRTSRALELARDHQRRTGRNLFADVLAAEQAAGVRVVRQTRHWTAFVPAAARWPVEVHVYPNRQVPDLPALTAAERDDFGVLYLDLLRRLDRLHGQPLPYVAGWHQAPVRTGHDLAWLRLEISSIQRTAAKLKYLAGSEAGMGVFINDVLPESGARRLREAGA